MILDRSRLVGLVEDGWDVIAASDEIEAATPLLLEVTLKRDEREETRFVDREAWAFAMTEMERRTRT